MTQYAAKVLATFVPSIALLTLYFGYNGLNNTLPELNASSLVMPAILIPIVAAISCSLFVWYTFDTAYKAYHETIPHNPRNLARDTVWVISIGGILCAVIYQFNLLPFFKHTLSTFITKFSAGVHYIFQTYLLLIAIGLLQKFRLSHKTTIITSCLIIAGLSTLTVTLASCYYLAPLTSQQVVGIILTNVIASTAFGWLFCTSSPYQAWLSAVVVYAMIYTYTNSL